MSLAFCHQVMFQFFHFSLASSSLGAIKNCVNTHGVENKGRERPKVRGEKRKVRGVHEEGCLCESLFLLRIVREGAREA